MIGRSLHPRIAADERGVTVVEFGIVAPALFLFLIGLALRNRFRI